MGVFSEVSPPPPPIPLFPLKMVFVAIGLLPKSPVPICVSRKYWKNSSLFFFLLLLSLSLLFFFSSHFSLSFFLLLSASSSCCTDDDPTAQASLDVNRCFARSLRGSVQFRVQELCERGSGSPGLPPSLIVRTVSVLN